MNFFKLWLIFIFGGLMIHLQNVGAAENMRVHVMRLVPGDDVKAKLESFVNEKKIKAAIMLTAVGSLTEAQVRFSNDPKTTKLRGPFEVVSLTGTLGSMSGSHLHISVSDRKGKTLGGHLMAGSLVFTTLEVALGEMTDITFSRELDPVSTFKELRVSPTQK
jgi:predicted DNA-binding protein with PD1-like motif